MAMLAIVISTARMACPKVANTQVAKKRIVASKNHFLLSQPSQDNATLEITHLLRKVIKILQRSWQFAPDRYMRQPAPVLARVRAKQTKLLKVASHCKCVVKWLLRFNRLTNITSLKNLAIFSHECRTSDSVNISVDERSAALMRHDSCFCQKEPQRCIFWHF